jgi:hypothetical protein
MRITASLMLAATAAALATTAIAQPRGPQGPQPAQPQGVCVYGQPNFQGPPTCYPVGTRIPNVGPQLNKRIYSIQVPPGARVTVCSEYNFGGACSTVDRPMAETRSLGDASLISSLSSEAGGRGNEGPPRSQFGGPQQPLPPGPPPRGQQFGGQPGMDDRGDRRREMFQLRRACEDGDTRACVQFGIIIGENRERRAQWKRENPELFWWER